MKPVVPKAIRFLVNENYNYNLRGYRIKLAEKLFPTVPRLYAKLTLAVNVHKCGIHLLINSQQQSAQTYLQNYYFKIILQTKLNFLAPQTTNNYSD